MSQEHLQQLHAKAESYLKLKLEKLPARVFGEITLEQIYAGKEPQPRIQLPEYLTLTAFFNGYDELRRSNFQDQKGGQDPSILRAIFFYGLDRSRCFSHHLDNVRYNLVAMAVFFVSPDCDNMSDHAAIRDFCMEFIVAWRESILPVQTVGVRQVENQERFIKMLVEGPYDLIQFNASRKKLLMKHRVVPSSVAVEKPVDYFKIGSNIDRETFNKYAPQMALRFCLDSEREDAEDLKKYNMQMAEQHGDLASGCLGSLWNLVQFPWRMLTGMRLLSAHF
jgi:hypothetical protein